MRQLGPDSSGWEIENREISDPTGPFLYRLVSAELLAEIAAARDSLQFHPALGRQWMRLDRLRGALADHMERSGRVHHD